MQFRVTSPAEPGTAIRVTVRLFAQYAELVGTSAVTVELPPGATVADAVAAVRQQAKYGQKLPARPLAAVNLAHVLPDQRLSDGDELALLPPVAGG
ncbi:MAG: MoaD/ThiS family protein [Gemmatimonadetes bacterium]|nr:MoaD/ThiS family protein [Gemmatimonadota bacterium]MBI2402929.1 MoaD/ThiS family protein [Gemmatimonadota bacterium]MBI2537515.1 MoaD/ThiS family protein [Gemmatimonadota bacterium]MBI2616292.1 MoaD/ThiS family protein [Gemmatimonadota bacterium]MBI3082479.1 MoaD/ThiS family protein [Gemmatimonadota bacterium]